MDVFSRSLGDTVRFYRNKHGLTQLQLADRILEGKYSYVCATHMDKDHVHSHIVFCAADNVRHRKYNESRESYRKIRQYNDEICAEHGLSVIPSSGYKGKH